MHKMLPQSIPQALLFDLRYQSYQSFPLAIISDCADKAGIEKHCFLPLDSFANLLLIVTANSTKESETLK